MKWYLFVCKIFYKRQKMYQAPSNNHILSTMLLKCVVCIPYGHCPKVKEGVKACQVGLEHFFCSFDRGGGAKGIWTMPICKNTFQKGAYSYHIALHTVIHDLTQPCLISRWSNTSSPLALASSAEHTNNVHSDLRQTLSLQTRQIKQSFWGGKA